MYIFISSYQKFPFYSKILCAFEEQDPKIVSREIAVYIAYSTCDIYRYSSLSFKIEAIIENKHLRDSILPMSNYFKPYELFYFLYSPLQILRNYTK